MAEHGVVVEVDSGYRVAAVRYFEATDVGPLGAMTVPAPLQVVTAAHPTSGRPSILAWRSPTMSLLITEDAALLETIAASLRASGQGYCVEQSEGIELVRLHGPGIAQLMLRLGAPTCVPAPGEARTSRMAELAVTAIGVHQQEILLAVERVYADHLCAWIEQTLADLTAQRSSG